MDANTIYSETRVEQPFTTDVGPGRVVTPRATPEKILNIAKDIWREVCAAPDNERANSALLERLQAEQRDFATSFPLVLRWMVQMRQYDRATFHEYLLKHAGAKFDTREDFLRFQGEYLVMLYKRSQAHADERKVREYRAMVCDNLLKEDAEFTKIQAEVAEEIKREASDASADRRRALYEALMRSRATRP